MRYNLIRFLLMRHAVRTLEHRTSSIRQHRLITEAYEDGDYKLAEKLTEEHYRYGVHLIDGEPD